MTDKINGEEYIYKVCEWVHNHPDIQPKDHRKVIAKILQPMIEELFGNEYEPYEEKEDEYWMALRTYDINQYALKLRRSGKLLREIGEELGVSKERARTRVILGTRQEKAFERGKNTTIMGDLFMSYKPMAAIKHLGAENMTFTEFLENVSQQKLVETIHVGKEAVKEILYELRKKNVSEKIIQDWLNVEFKKVKKVKKKRCDAGIPNGPEEKFETCQQFVIDEGRMFMGSLCNEPLLTKQKKYCTEHKRNKP